MAAFDLLKAVVSQPSGWGIRDAFAHASFAELLLAPYGHTPGCCCCCVCSDPLCVWRLLYSDTEPSAECMRHKHDVILAVIGCPAASQALSMLRGTHAARLLIRVAVPLVAGAGVLQRLRDVASLGPFRTISTATGAASTEPAPVVATQAS